MSLSISKLIAEVIYEKKGEEILILNLEGKSPIAKFFIICTATSSIHAQAISDSIKEELHKMNHSPHHIEGYERGTWVLLDYLDIVVHIFVPETRTFYGLERLWGDAKTIRFHAKEED